MDCAFFGVALPPGEKVPLRAEYDEDMAEVVHITQIALGAKPKPGPHTIFVGKEGKAYAVGTLSSTGCTQFTCDITFSMDEVELSQSGPSEVHLTGYRVVQMVACSDDEDGLYGHYDSSDEEGGSDKEGESDDDEAPAAVPLKGLAKLAVKARARQLIDDEAEEASSEEESGDDVMEDDDEDEDDSEEEEKRPSKRHFRVIGDDDEDSSEPESLSSGEEDEEDESDEEEQAPPAAAKQKAAAAPPAKKQQAQAAPQKAAQQQKPVQQAAAKDANGKGAKRAAAAQTPQPAKKAKGAEQQKVPATAPAKVAPAGTATPSNDKDYLTSLKAALKDGPLKLAALGTKAKRPPGVPKVKLFVDKHPGVFKYDKDNDLVSLA